MHAVENHGPGEAGVGPGQPSRPPPPPTHPPSQQIMPGSMLAQHSGRAEGEVAEGRGSFAAGGAGGGWQWQQQPAPGAASQRGQAGAPPPGGCSAVGCSTGGKLPAGPPRGVEWRGKDAEDAGEWADYEDDYEDDYGGRDGRSGGGGMPRMAAADGRSGGGAVPWVEAGSCDAAAAGEEWDVGVGAGGWDASLSPHRAEGGGIFSRAQTEEGTAMVGSGVGAGPPSPAQAQAAGRHLLDM